MNLMLLGTAFVLGGCANALMEAPYNEDAALMTSRNREWGAHGDYCRDVFEKRVEHWDLPRLIRDLRRDCSKSNGAACLDLARATSGGCGDLKVDEPWAYLLARSSCALGAIDGCHTYVGWCSSGSARSCKPIFVADAKRRIELSQNGHSPSPTDAGVEPDGASVHR